jgi:hypothetical protein
MILLHAAVAAIVPNILQGQLHRRHVIHLVPYRGRRLAILLLPCLINLRVNHYSDTWMPHRLDGVSHRQF